MKRCISRWIHSESADEANKNSDVEFAGKKSQRVHIIMRQGRIVDAILTKAHPNLEMATVFVHETVVTAGNVSLVVPDHALLRSHKTVLGDAGCNVRGQTPRTCAQAEVPS